YFQQALFGSYFRRRIVIVFRMTDSAEEDGVGCFCFFQSLVRQRISGSLGSRVPHYGFVEAKFVTVLPRDGFYDLFTPGRYFLGYAIPWDHEDIFLRFVHINWSKLRDKK